MQLAIYIHSLSINWKLLNNECITCTSALTNKNVTPDRGNRKMRNSVVIMKLITWENSPTRYVFCVNYLCITDLLNVYSNFIMFTLLFNFKLLSIFRCYRHYSTLLCIIVIIIHGSVGDTADSSIVRHGYIESTSIITNSSSSSQPSSSASSISLKSHTDNLIAFSTTRKFNGLLYLQ